MAIGKSGSIINLKKLNIKIGDLNIILKGKIYSHYSESDASEYMKNSNIDIIVDPGSGSKNFTAYTMDLTKKYIEINSDYRS